MIRFKGPAHPNVKLYFRSSENHQTEQFRLIIQYSAKRDYSIRIVVLNALFAVKITYWERYMFEQQFANVWSQIKQI